MNSTINALFSQQPLLRQLLEKQEIQRKKTFKKLVWQIVGVLLLATLASWLLFLSFDRWTIFLDLFLAVIGVMICSYFADKENKVIYKKEIMPLLVETLIQNKRECESDVISYNPDFNVSLSTFESNPLFSGGNRIASEDLISGQLGKTKFMIYEAHYWYHTGGKNSHDYNRFKGLVFSADFNKNFHGLTTISDGKPDGLSIFSHRDMDKVTLEAGPFSKIFDVYSNDGQEARYIITPSFMERILQLEEKTRKIRKKDIGIVFRNSQMEVYIPSGHDYFEPKLLRTLVPEDLSQDFEVMELLLSLINIMQLNTRIWTKE